MEIPTSPVEKARFVRVIFTDVEKEYDALLRIFTLGLDWVWRRRMLSKVNYRAAMRVLDLACGTGLVTFAISESLKPESLVVGLDPSASMLRTAANKKRAARAGCPVELVRATAEYMPFRGGIFGYETIGLALRNFADKSAMLGEAHRTLTNSGWLLSVDFVVPERTVVRLLYMFHVLHVLPRLGLLVSTNWHRTLQYLARSIQASDAPTDVCRMIFRHGFRRTLSERMSLGLVALVGGQK